MKIKPNKYDLTPEQIDDLRELYVERYIDNMTTEDLCEYVHNTMTYDVEKQSDAEFLSDCEDYWDDHFPDIVEEIKEDSNA